MTPLSILSAIPIHLPHSTPLLARRLYKLSNEIQYLELLNQNNLKQSLSPNIKPFKLPEKRISLYGHLIP